MLNPEPAPTLIESEPFYAPSGDEIKVFEAAWRNRLPVLLKGANRLWQNPFHGTHGVAPSAAAGYGFLS